jgi:hypothetical protein
VLLVSFNAHTAVGDQKCLIPRATMAIVPGKKVAHKRLTSSSSSPPGPPCPSPPLRRPASLRPLPLHQAPMRRRPRQSRRRRCRRRRRRRRRRRPRRCRCRWRRRRQYGLLSRSRISALVSAGADGAGPSGLVRSVTYSMRSCRRSECHTGSDMDWRSDKARS